MGIWDVHGKDYAGVELCRDMVCAGVRIVWGKDTQDTPHKRL